MNKKIYSFILFLTLSACGATQPNTDNKALNVIKNNQYEQSFRLLFGAKKDEIYIGSASSIYQKKAASDRTTTSRLSNVFRKVPEHLKNRLFASSTDNLFRQFYPYIYNKSNRHKYDNNCPFIGVEYEVDGRSNTTEWLIAAPIERCLFRENIDQYYYNYDTLNQHNWVLQRYDNNKYRVLLESDGEIDFTHDSTNKASTIGTRFEINRMLWDKDPMACGYLSTQWTYRSGKFYMNVAMYLRDYCSHTYSQEVPTDQARADLGKEEWWQHHYVKKIRRLIDPIIRIFALDSCHEVERQNKLICHK